MARGTSAFLTLFLVASILVLTTASQRRGDAVKRNLNSFNAETTPKILSSGASLTAAQTKAAGRKLLQDYGDEEDCDYTNDYCGQGSGDDGTSSDCDYTNDYCGQGSGDDDTSSDCDYTNDYCGEGPTVDADDETETEEEEEECDYSNDYCGEGPSDTFEAPDDDDETPSNGSTTPSNGSNTPSSPGGGATTVPVSVPVPVASGSFNSGGSTSSTGSQGTATPSSTPGSLPAQSATALPASAAAGSSASLPSQNGTAINGTAIAKPVNATGAGNATAPGAGNATAPGAEGSSFTAWSTHGAHYTTCVTGATIAIAFFTNFFF